MFKSACFFRISDDFELPPLQLLEEGLQKTAFVPCGATDPESSGWVPPRGNKGVALAEIVGSHLMLKLCTERRAVPASAVKSAVDEKIEKWKTETGNERVPAKLKKEFKEDVLQELLPRAFSKRGTVLLWLDPVNRLLVVDAGSLAGADRVVTALIEVLVDLPGGGPDLGLKPIQTQTSPAVSMAHWLTTREAPWRFTVDRDCELKMPDEQKSSVRYSRHTLEIDEVAQHIVAGKVPTQLAMTWNERVSFVLGDAGQVRKIKLLDVVMEGTDAPGKDEDGFDGNVAILTGELSALIPDLLLALGGELGVEDPAEAANAPQVAQVA
ncbi:MAG: recombination-associated protein RdgC [Ramlibacter sp.]|uniref:recombination-associated protein RdgC n=1 Tax=Ramlibacter sp. TaxID=1917967 RepID=UPI002604FB83|nr:recombination-associated protein RdgC [Ramlibacter sp.]MDB5753562.1 recombination-associated protein RdgC [Ramlibacter sp.]